MIPYFLSKELKQSLERVYTLTNNRNIGMISACRREHGGADAQENRNRTAELKSRLLQPGRGFVQIKGTYIENAGTPGEVRVGEHSFLLIGEDGYDGESLLNFLQTYGGPPSRGGFDQDSIFFKPWNSEEGLLYGFKDDVWPYKGRWAAMGPWHPNRSPVFSTLMSHGSSFKFSPGAEAEEEDELKKENPGDLLPSFEPTEADRETTALRCRHCGRSLLDQQKWEHHLCCEALKEDQTPCRAILRGFEERKLRRCWEHMPQLLKGGADPSNQEHMKYVREGEVDLFTRERITDEDIFRQAKVQWEDFGFYNQISFFSRKECLI